MCDETDEDVCSIECKNETIRRHREAKNAVAPPSCDGRINLCNQQRRFFLQLANWGVLQVRYMVGTLHQQGRIDSIHLGCRLWRFVEDSTSPLRASSTIPVASLSSLHASDIF